MTDRTPTASPLPDYDDEISDDQMDAIRRLTRPSPTEPHTDDLTERLLQMRETLPGLLDEALAAVRGAPQDGLAEELERLIETRALGAIVSEEEGDNIGPAARRVASANADLGHFIGTNWPAILSALRRPTQSDQGRVLTFDQVCPTQSGGVSGLASRIEKQIWKAEANFDDNLKAVLEECQTALRPAGVVDGDGWLSIENAPKDGTILELVVDYSDGEHPLNDAAVSCTIGFNNFDNDGEDDWDFAGWCWCHDHFTEGKGRVVAWRPSRLNAYDDALSPLPDPPALAVQPTEGEKRDG